jgi:hypothetical protein
MAANRGILRASLALGLHGELFGSAMAGEIGTQ